MDVLLIMQASHRITRQTSETWGKSRVSLPYVDQDAGMRPRTKAGPHDEAK